jgi:hypothetical protein
VQLAALDPSLSGNGQRKAARPKILLLERYAGAAMRADVGVLEVGLA